MKKPSLRRIQLIWRKSRGERRIKVGIITRGGDNVVKFKYNLKNCIDAQSSGFVSYPDFPDLRKEYTQNVLQIFGQRLTNTERSDIQKYYDFWSIDPKFSSDIFYVLAQTQGLLSTDNFEFLAEYQLQKDLSFISEIAGLSFKGFTKGKIKVGDQLRWEIEPNNKYDSKAVKVFIGKDILGYIKCVHSEVFYDKRADSLQVHVKNIEHNEQHSRVFITISVKN